MNLDSNKSEYIYSGIDIIRILAATGITVIHILGYSNIFNNELLVGVNYFLMVTLKIFSRTAVNLFGLITGYLMVSKVFKISRVTSLFATVFSVTGFLLICRLVIGFFGIKGELSLYDILISLFPITTEHYWYIFVYFLLLLIMPFLNKIIDFCTKQNLKKFLILTCFIICIFIELNPFVSSELFIGSAWSIIWMSYLYLVGGYLKKYNVNKKKFMIILVNLIIASYILSYVFSRLFFQQFRENFEIIPFLISVSLFVLLKDISFKRTKLIRYMANFSLFVYLFQENIFIHSILWQTLDINNHVDSHFILLYVFLYLMIVWLFAFVLYNICNLIYKLIFPLFNKIGTFIYSKIISY